MHEFGWVQNPNDFQKLKYTVQILLHGSFYNCKLLNGYVNYIYDRAKRLDIIHGLSKNPVCLDYYEMTGKVNYPNDIDAKNKKRKNQVADGVVQLSAGNPNRKQSNGSPKPWTDNWTSYGYLNWALTFHFLEVNEQNDSISLTKEGKRFAQSQNNSENEKEYLIEAIMAYPPAVRILSLLQSNKDKYGKESLVSKFILGHNVGFTGEAGFTSFDEGDWFGYLRDAKDKSKVRSDKEGSADKWVRTIASWLKKLGLIKQHRLYHDKEFTSHAYAITLNGELALKRAYGNSKHPAIPRFVSWHMLATSIKNKIYVQKRRAYTIIALKSHHTFDGISSFLKDREMFNGKGVVRADIHKLINFGLRIENLNLKDHIYGLNLKALPRENSLDDKQLLTVVNRLQNELTSLDSSDIDIVQMAWKKSPTRSGKQNNADLFESRTFEILRKYLQLYGRHLGGPNKPDAIAYDNKHDFGIIIDTKAYSTGYRMNASQKREMIDYIKELKQRDQHYSKLDWWKYMPADLNHFYYLWISGSFIGQFREGLQEVHNKTNINGGAMEIIALLRLSNAVKQGEINNHAITHFMTNDLINDERIQEALIK